MTREQAKRVLEFNLDHTHNNESKKALRMAIKALKQQMCEDAVSREDALMALTGEWTESTDELIHRFIRRIKNLPSVNPQRTGHWIEVAKYSDGKHEIKCSECESHIFDRGHANSYVVKEKYKYCPRCGAKMVEPQESEE